MMTTDGFALVVANIDDNFHKTKQSAIVAICISYSDAENSPATQDQFRDPGTGASSGYFWTPGNEHWAANTDITVNAADLANLWVRGGQVAGSETMQVRAFDGTDWSAWDPFTLTTAGNTALVATISDHNPQTNQTT